MNLTTRQMTQNTEGKFFLLINYIHIHYQLFAPGRLPQLQCNHYHASELSIVVLSPGPGRPSQSNHYSEVFVVVVVYPGMCWNPHSNYNHSKNLQQPPDSPDSSQETFLLCALLMTQIAAFEKLRPCMQMTCHCCSRIDC